jgi:pimeloyl-ACP methyl ester carboxylesterase
MPFAERGTHRIHYEVRGRQDAPPLLLIMGMGFSRRAWHTLPHRLDDDFRVVLLDNRGTGQSTAPRGLCRTRDMAEDALAVLDAAGAGRAFVFGMSMGGMIAQELAVRHPGRVRALALGATFAGHLRSRKPSLRTRCDLLLSFLGGPRTPRAVLARFLVSAEYFTADGVGFERWLRTAEHAATAVVLAQLAAVARHESAAALARVALPTLILTGTADRLVPPENSRKLAALIPGARLVELRGAGHVFPVERPGETVAALKDFFLGHVAPEAAAAASPARA